MQAEGKLETPLAPEQPKAFWEDDLAELAGGESSDEGNEPEQEVKEEEKDVKEEKPIDEEEDDIEKKALGVSTASAERSGGQVVRSERLRTLLKVITLGCL